VKESLLKKLRKIKLLILDVDGVLTDNGVYVGSDGIEFKKFNIQDGFGIYLVQKAGVKVALLSGRYSKATEYRAQELKIEHVYNGYTDKLKVYQELKEKLSLQDEEIIFVGDDLPDLPVLESVGVPMTVANAQPELKKVAEYVTRLPGGKGAVREIVNLILKAKKFKY
jgi:3-deoxy-D-manno-octulosonate 8-phosphate phosphatase (KDO 8-P phosphatase)